ncbi:MAG: class I SAM-dependent methyltransferase [Gammaproteobacteria bacterium]|nr:class I SAM-dependent methyltransferase [Gammaproteobacteria bacterium]
MQLSTKADAARRALRSPQRISATTRARLERLSAAFDQQASCIAQLLQEVRPVGLGAPLATHLALKTRLPPSQGLTSYHANLHRDWVWGGQENDAAHSMVSAVLSQPADGTWLVLGAGAGRLAYDLARAASDRSVVAVDLNPLFMVAAQQISAGASLEHIEFPLAPVDGESIAITRTLSAPGAVSNLKFVLADAMRAPFVAGSVGAVITPWFIDVIDEDLPRLAQRINRLLAPGGRWVIFGSLVFDHPDPRRQYSHAEVLEILTGAGFEDVVEQEQDIPYLCSPASRHGRRERVVAIGSTKRSESEAPPRHEALPEWLTHSNRAVPQLESFKLQAMSTRIYAFIMSLIDGKRSLRDMAVLMEEQKLMPRREAEEAIRGFLVKMYDEAQRPPPS